MRLFQRTTVERAHAERYEQMIRQGHYVIAVHLHEVEQREQVRQLLKAHGGHFINFYGRYAIRKLDP
ncbi:MAG: hypothetical protein DYG89_53675 [Caldilinea sp. CFX5]|nr:hypothetical protein [Caldilinea sp. CFX5]